MNKEKISNVMLKILISTGWYPDRKYNIESWILELEKEGYVLNEYANTILKELGGICITYNGNKQYMGIRLDFNPYNAASGEYDRIEKYKYALDDKIFPVAEFYDYVVYAGKSQKIYLVDWTGIYAGGNNIEDFLNNIIDKSFVIKKYDNEGKII